MSKRKQEDFNTFYGYTNEHIRLVGMEAGNRQQWYTYAVGIEAKEVIYDTKKKTPSRV